MPLRCAKAQKGLAQGREDGTRVTPQFGAEVLGAVEDAGGLEELDAAVDLVHVVAAAERIERELGCHYLTRLRGSPDLLDGGCDPLRERLAIARVVHGRADRIVRFAWATA